MRAAEHTPRGPRRVLDRRHSLAEIVERGAGVLVERPRVIHPDPKRGRVIDPGATLDDLREAVTTLEDAGRTARRVFGDAHPTTLMGEALLGDVRATLRARETPPPPATS